MFAAILAFTTVMTSTAMSYSSMLNSALGISTGKFVPKEGAATEEPIFYASDYGDVNHLTQENLDALLADEDAFVELEEEEGAVLLRNNNNALPLTEGERKVTLFGHTSADPLYKNSSGGGNIDPNRVISFARAYNIGTGRAAADDNAVIHHCVLPAFHIHHIRPRCVPGFQRFWKAPFPALPQWRRSVR